MGLDRPLEHNRAGAPRYKGARPDLCGRLMTTKGTPYRSLLQRISFPVTTLLGQHNFHRCFLHFHAHVPVEA